VEAASYTTILALLQKGQDIRNLLYNEFAYVRTARLAAIPPLSRAKSACNLPIHRRNINIKDIKETNGTRNSKVV
jgi:hypothetical protein